MATIIDDSNIKQLVNWYIEDRASLPPDLQAKDINDWVVSGVYNMSNLFENYADFNSNIEGWDVSSVTDMSEMFKGCTSFNQPLNGWGDKTSLVETMKGMFEGCVSFNYPLDRWDVSNVTDMSEMFKGCTSFNSDLNEWGDTVSEVQNLSAIFKDCVNFDKPLDRWVIFGNMFIGEVDMSFMFAGCSNFNQPLNMWITISVQNMEAMFKDCTLFNQPLDSWKLYRVVNMKALFMNCTSFNQDLSNWNETASYNLMKHAQMFENCPIEAAYLPTEILNDETPDKDVPYINNTIEYILNHGMNICDAIRCYSNKFDYYVHNLLRIRDYSLPKPLMNLVRNIIAELDAEFEKAPKITQEMVDNGDNIFYRGETKLLENGLCRSGYCESYSSTSKNVRIGARFTSEVPGFNCCLYEYHIMVGVPYIEFNKYKGAEYGIPEEYCGFCPQEEEFLFPRGIELNDPIDKGFTELDGKSIRTFIVTVSSPEYVIMLNDEEPVSKKRKGGNKTKRRRPNKIKNCSKRRKRSLKLKRKRFNKHTQKISI